MLLKPYTVRYFSLKNLSIVNIAPLDTPELTQNHSTYLCKILDPYFPEKFNLATIVFKGENGTVFNLTTCNPIISERLKQIFSSYINWFTNNEARIFPQFVEIKEEINDYLVGNYGGINPSKNGFINWFIYTTLEKTTIDLKIEPTPALGPNEWRIVGIENNSTFGTISPCVVEKYLHEYCAQKLQQQNSLKAEITNNIDDKTLKIDNIIIREAFTPKEQEAIVERILAPLNGINPSGEMIMAPGEYVELVKHTKHFILFNEMPTNPDRIQQIKISTEHIRYTFYRLHEALFTTVKIRQSFITFLSSMFRQFENQESETTRKKFSVPPKSYLRDFNIC